MRGITAGVLVAVLAVIGAGYGVLTGITLATVVITDIENTLPYRLLLTAGGTFGGLIGAACNVSLGLVLYGFVVTMRDTLRSRRDGQRAGG